MRGINPKFLDKLNEVQRKFLMTAVGLRFYSEFLLAYGHHIFLFGTTFSGKSNKGYWLVDWLKHLENQIWFDSGKQGEILPLLCMDRKVRIILPMGCDLIIEERIEGKWQKIQNHPDIVRVSSPSDAISAISEGSWDNSWHRVRDTITIISFRNSFSRKELAIGWVAEFFENLAERARNPHAGGLPKITPASIHVDESQWAIAGKRVSGEGERTKASEIIAENAMELRSAQFRLVLYSQSYIGIPPAARENMLFNIICRGGMVSSEENGNLSKWCNNAEWRTPHSPMQYKVWHGRFVFENGDSYPPLTPWKFRLYPIKESDRKWIAGLRVRYEGRHDQRTGEEEIQEECFPELGRFSLLAIKPEVQEMVASRFDAPRGEIDDG
jgi:hypothetical protein